MSRPRIAVAGAGVVGLTLGLALLKRNAAVDLHDDYPHPPASAVAAGMLSPAFESALDPVGGSYALLARAGALWPGLLDRLGASDALVRCGGLFAGQDEQRLAALHQALKAAGAEAALLSPAEARALQPGLAHDIAGAVLAPGESRVAPVTLLARLREAFVREGGRFLPSRLSPQDPPTADALVLASGFEAAAFSSRAAELSVLQPIKGQILVVSGAGPTDGPMVRGEGAYVSPQPAGALIGATMEAGRADLELDPDILQGLQARAARLFPDLAGAPAAGRVGVRAATPDGLPMAGPSSSPGLFLASGVRRNGWLLAPLLAEVVADAVLGRPPGSDAAAFDPRRFA